MKIRMLNFFSFAFYFMAFVISYCIVGIIYSGGITDISTEYICQIIVFLVLVNIMLVSFGFATVFSHLDSN